MSSTEQIKELRNRTGISIAQCKQALEEAAGDMDKALESLKARGAEIANKKADRELGSGVMGSYVHNNLLIGSLVELACETDFVAKNPEFIEVANDLAMHLTATGSEDIDSLLAEPYIKNPEQTIADVIKEATQKFGERVNVVKISRLEVGA
ncbi:MAG: translation elongation factor Ts [Patescibacteria group bacterium]